MREIENFKKHLEILGSLEDGWLDGEEGKALDKDGLKWLQQVFLKYYTQELLQKIQQVFLKYYPQELLQKIQQPYVFPTIDGGVRFEWWLSNKYDVSLTIDLQSHTGYWHVLDVKENKVKERILFLDKENDWEFIKKSIEKMIEGGN